MNTAHLDALLDQELERRKADEDALTAREEAAAPERIAACSTALLEAIGLPWYAALCEAGLTIVHRPSVLGDTWETVALWEYGDHGFSIEFHPGKEPQWRLEQDGSGKWLPSDRLVTTIRDWLLLVRGTQRRVSTQ